MNILRKIIVFLGIAFIILIIFLIITFSILKHLRIKEIVEREIEHSLGINVTINKINFSPFLAHIAATGITIHNPSGFVEDELAYIDAIHFVCDPLEIVTMKKPNIYLFALDLKRLNIIKDRDGKVNIKEIISISKEDTSVESKTSFYFDVVVLSVGEVNYIDYSQGTKREHKYPIGIKNATFISLKNEDDVVKMVIYKAIENTDIGKLINLKIVPVVSQIKDTMDAAWGTARTGAKGALSIAALPFKLLFN
ncbi:MAG: AsmA family protein [Candidatus Omnitrophica bacterium]|nr:AsmA family protein [Candidatus Omnitrophota bacterium]